MFIALYEVMIVTSLRVYVWVCVGVHVCVVYAGNQAYLCLSGIF